MSINPAEYGFTYVGRGYFTKDGVSYSTAEVTEIVRINRTVDEKVKSLVERIDYLESILNIHKQEVKKVYVLRNGEIRYVPISELNKNEYYSENKEVIETLKSITNKFKRKE